LTANTIQFTRSYLSFCEDLLKVYSANRHQLITSAFTDIFTAHVNCLQRAASSDKFKQEVMIDQMIRSSTSFGWDKGWNVTSAGWQVTLCKPIWHVSSSSGEACCELLYPVTLLYFTTRCIALASHSQRKVRRVRRRIIRTVLCCGGLLYTHTHMITC